MKPYKIIGDLKRYDRHNSAFARRRVERGASSDGKAGKSREQIAPTSEPGYGYEDFALKGGAWAIAKQSRDGDTEEQMAGAPEEMQVVHVTEVKRYQPQDWKKFTEQLKDVGRFYGASLVGVTRVNPLWVFASNGNQAPLPEDLDTAVVMAIEMDYDLINTSPAVTASGATGKGYSQMAFTSTCVARYLTELGWDAVAAGNDMALSIPLAIDAGLGELGRNGILITEKYGPRVRLCKVFTSAPLVTDEPITFGVREFCEVCMKCAHTCPSRSITKGQMTDSGLSPSNNPGVLKWYINPDPCLAFWSANRASCSNCIRSCPFNKRVGWFHNLVRRFIRVRWRWLDKVMVFMDTLCGYGKQTDPAKAWKKLTSK